MVDGVVVVALSDLDGFVVVVVEGLGCPVGKG